MTLTNELSVESRLNITNSVSNRHVQDRPGKTQRGISCHYSGRPSRQRERHGWNDIVFSFQGRIVL